MPDWHPGSKEMVQNLVHPSMYPLIYGRTRVLREEVVGIEGAIEKWAGKGSIVPKVVPEHDSTFDSMRTGVGGNTVPANLWSDTYQWLPANVQLQKDGSAKFTSYINNLHPDKYPEIYRTIEKLVQAALPAWDQCLNIYRSFKRHGAGRLSPRFPYPEDPDDENGDNWTPSDPSELDDVEIDWEAEWRREYGDHHGQSLSEHEEDDLKTMKWEYLRQPIIPEAVFEDVEYQPKLSERLQEKYPELQVIVKMASIELTPEKPEFSAGGWHVSAPLSMTNIVSEMAPGRRSNERAHLRDRTVLRRQRKHHTKRHLLPHADICLPGGRYQRWTGWLPLA